MTGQCKPFNKPEILQYNNDNNNNDDDNDDDDDDDDDVFFKKNNDFLNTFLAAQMRSITLGGSPEF